MSDLKEFRHLRPNARLDFFFVAHGCKNQRCSRDRSVFLPTHFTDAIALSQFMESLVNILLHSPAKLTLLV